LPGGFITLVMHAYQIKTSPGGGDVLESRRRRY